MILKERARLAHLERSKQFEKRMRECERLNELIKADNPDDLTYLLGRPDSTQRENPFYMALQAQKKERLKYKQLLHLAIENEMVSSRMQSQKSQMTASNKLDPEQAREIQIQN